MARYRKPNSVKRKTSIIKSKFFWIGILGLISISLISYYLFFSETFQIKSIIILGNQKIAKEDILKIIEDEFSKNNILSLNENIFLANIGAAEKNIFKVFPQIVEIKSSKDFPDTLSFNITERVQVAWFCKVSRLLNSEGEQESIERCFLLDKDGVIFEEVSSSELRLVKIKNPNSDIQLELGQKMIESETLSMSLDILLGIETLGVPVEEVLVLSEERINVKTSQGWKIYLNPRKDLEWQFRKLKADLDEFIPLEKRKDLEYIELRFGNLAPFKYLEGGN